MSHPSDRSPAGRLSLSAPRTWRTTNSATAATTGASAFLALAMTLSFVPEHTADVTLARGGDRTAAWQLRGTLPDDGVASPAQASTKRAERNV